MGSLQTLVGVRPLGVSSRTSDERLPSTSRCRSEEVSVADVLLQHGEWEFGRFATRYRLHQSNRTGVALCGRLARKCTRDGERSDQGSLAPVLALESATLAAGLVSAGTPRGKLGDRRPRSDLFLGSLFVLATVRQKVNRRRRIDGAGFCSKLFYAGGRSSSGRAIPLPTGRCSS